MKIKILLISLMLIILICIFAVGCDIHVDENGGSIISNLTALPPPINVQVVDGYIKWDSVPNASSYVVKINGREENCGNALRCSISSVVDQNVGLDSPTELHIVVKAVGNSIYYSDSNWSSEVLYIYKKNLPYGDKLSTPTNLKISNNIVSWDPVEGAIGYQIRINEDTNVYSTACTYYDISRFFNATTYFDISIQSIASNSSNLNSSEWTLKSPFQYVYRDESSDFDSSYVSMGLGRTIDLINGTPYDLKSGAGYIFDMDKLFSLQVRSFELGKQDATYEYDTSFEEFQKKWSLDAGLKIAKNKDKDLVPFPIMTDFSIDLNCEYEKSTKENTKELYIKMKHNIAGVRHEIIGHATDYDFLSSILSDKFKSAVKKVVDEKSAEDFISAWGTHVIMGIVYGASIEASYFNISHNTYSAENWYVNLEAAVKKGLGLSTLEVDVKDETTVNKSQTTKNVISKFEVKANGGNSVAFSNDLGHFQDAYNSWASGVQESNYTLVDYPDSSLYCIWDYLDDSYTIQKQILNDYLISHTNANLAYIRERISGIYNSEGIEYIDSTNLVTYNSETKTLEFDFGTLQEKNDITKEYFDYDRFNEGVLSVNPIYKGKEILKVVFKGDYLKNSNIDNHKITSTIKNMRIVFSNWTSDIDIVFENFGYISNKAMIPLDFSSVPSDKTVTITFVGNNYIGVDYNDSIVCNGNLTIKGENSISTILKGSVKANGEYYSDAKGLTISETNLSSTRYRYEEKTITSRKDWKNHQDHWTFNQIFGLSKEELINAGYTKVKVDIKIDIKEKEDGYQWVSIDSGYYENKDHHLALWKLEHGPNRLDKNWWTYNVSAFVNINDVSEFYIVYCVDGKDEKNDWVNSNLEVKFTLVK